MEAEADGQQREFRQAVHTVLVAIGESHHLSASMLIKGGILLAIRYQGNRYTRDIDFSTDGQYRDFNEARFLEELESALRNAVNRLDYDLDCRVQAHQIQPANHPDPSFPTLKLNIGYAPKHHAGRHRRLRAGVATEIVSVDYSFNEVTLDIEDIVLTDGGQLRAYSFSDVVAEKFRALLQQEVRNRFRRQDAYDLYELLNRDASILDEEKQTILASLRRKSESRELDVAVNSLQDEAIVARSREDYATLATEIPGDLPDFDDVYATIRQFYESLPW